MTLTLCLFCNAADPGPDPDPEEVTLGAGAEVEAVVGPLEEPVGVAVGKLLVCWLCPFQLIFFFSLSHIELFHLFLGTEWPATIQATSHAGNCFLLKIFVSLPFVQRT